MTEITNLSETTFQTEVLDSEQPVLVDFTAVWCGPCKMLDPVVKELAEDWDGKLKVTKLDVDHNPNIAMQYQVMGKSIYLSDQALHLYGILLPQVLLILLKFY